jgi:hypothetical protein
MKFHNCCCWDATSKICLLKIVTICNMYVYRKAAVAQPV